MTLRPLEFEASALSNRNQNDLLEVRDWVAQRMGIHFPNDKLNTLEQRLGAVLAQCKLTDHQALLSELNQGSSHVHIALARNVSTNHTLFFREQSVLKRFFESHYKPPGPGAQHRFWSAASSTGEEAYTVLMMLDAQYGQVSERVRLLGTDISDRAIQHAQKGEYVGSRMSDVPALFKERYFKKTGADQWTISPQIQRASTFRRLNLLHSPWPFHHKMHVVFCRNVLYYFTKANQEKVLRHIYNATAPNGFLITSVTESFSDLDVPWVQRDTGIHQKEVR